MAQQDAHVHWGQWLLRRAELVGFRRQEDFAAAVGVSRQHLSKWAAMDRPPSHMRKGFDAALAYALETTTRVLLVDYVQTKPEDAVNKWAFTGDDSPLNKAGYEQLPARERGLALNEYLYGDFLRLWVQIGENCARIIEAEQRRAFEKNMSHYTPRRGDPPVPPNMTARAIRARQKKKRQ